jgi:chorismate mutase/prephenate dehydratase
VTTPLRVAYQGVEGAYSHLAAQFHYAGRVGGVLLAGHETFRRCAEAVRDGSVDFALLPVENTTAGSVPEVYDLIAELELGICGEVVSRVVHCLLALPGTRLEQIRTVISHPQALAQCEAFLHALPGVEQRAEFDTAGAARRVREAGDPSLAAVASESAAHVYGLEVLERGIQNQEGNYTRFVEIAREPRPCPQDVPCRTTLRLSLAHEPGSLGRVLMRFGERGVNLSRIESRPVPGEPWRYRFYLDLDGHVASAEVAGALRDIAQLVSEQRLLGTYPAAKNLPDPPR